MVSTYTGQLILFSVTSFYPGTVGVDTTSDRTEQQVRQEMTNVDKRHPYRIVQLYTKSLTSVD